jgi:hypothetical protein
MMPAITMSVKDKLWRTCRTIADLHRSSDSMPKCRLPRASTCPMPNTLMWSPVAAWRDLSVCSGADHGTAKRA